jgi:hypothetical protein
MAVRDSAEGEISERRALRPPDSHTAGINAAARYTPLLILPRRTFFGTAARF